MASFAIRMRFLPLSASNSSTVVGCPMSSRKTVMSMSSEKRSIKPVSFGERGAAFEEQAGATSLQFVEERIERPANPEVFFDILLIGTEPVGSADEEVAALFFARRQGGLKSLGHRLLGRFALLMIGAGVCACLKGFGFWVAGGAPAFAC